MNKEQAEARIKELQEALDQSAANHNALLGRIAEVRHFLAMIDVMGIEEAELCQSDSQKA